MKEWNEISKEMFIMDSNELKDFEEILLASGYGYIVKPCSDGFTVIILGSV